MRHPDELKKAAATFNNQPLLSKHQPVTSRAHRADLTVGSTGTDAAYEHPFLDNSLVIWTQEGIDAVEDETQKELSSAYHYDADMTPGEYEGVRYDGVMRNIRGNHVALVKSGRAGSDVVVGDEALPTQKTGEVRMSKARLMTRKASVAAGALMVALKPVLAQDASIDLGPILLKAKPRKFAAAKKGILADLTKALNGVKLAQDGDVGEIVESVAELLDAIDGDKTIVDDADTTDVNAGAPPVDDTSMDSDMAAVKAYLKSKGVPDDVIAGMPGETKPDSTALDADETDEAKAARLKKEKDEKDDKVAKDKDLVSKPAMDAAIAAAVEQTRKDTIASMGSIEEAKRKVRPHTGELVMAFDSAEAVYRHAFKVIGRDVSKIEGAGAVAALEAMLDMVPVPGQRQNAQPTLAQDSATVTAFEAMHPNAKRIGRA